MNVQGRFRSTERSAEASGAQSVLVSEEEEEAYERHV